MSHAWSRVPLAVAAALVWTAGAANAQAPSGDDGTPPNWSPMVYAYVLMADGAERLDPFGQTGRREVLQLLGQGSPARGQFLRARLDRLGSDGWRQQGWYEIDGDVITLYYMDEDGGGRVEHGRYLHGRICFTDAEDGDALSFDYLPAEGSDVPPPPSPGAPEGGVCATARDRVS